MGRALLALLLLGSITLAKGETRIAVLDFQLNDLTLLPNEPQELARTASIRPMLEDALDDLPGVHVVSVDPTAAQAADAAVGYLFEHSEVAGRLGSDHGADWILVGRLHKPSFLFAYLMARLVNTSTGKVAEDIVVEIKGGPGVVTEKGVSRLAEKLSVRLAASQSKTDQE